MMVCEINVNEYWCVFMTTFPSCKSIPRKIMTAVVDFSVIEQQLKPPRNQ